VAGASTGPYSAGLPPGLSPADLTVYDGSLYFSGADAGGLFQLWESNGTAAGTHELTGVVGAATTGLAPSDLTVFNDQMLFSGADARGQIGLWETNGTAAGTHEITGIAGATTTGIGLDPSFLTVYNGEALFRGIDSSGLYGLWETNGTAAGTRELTGIAGVATMGVGFLPSNFFNYNGDMLFTGCDSSGLYGLWVSNGTAVGTHELTGIAGAQASGVGLDPTGFTVYNGEALFTGYDSSGKLGLWVTNGTVAGTHELTGVAGAATTGLAPTGLTAVGGPVLKAGAGIKYVAGAASVTLNAGLLISDTESTSLIGATVSIGAGFLLGDALSVGSPQTGITSSYNAATGVLTLSGAASLSAYQTALDSVDFASPSAANPSRAVAWSVNDGLATSASVSSSVSVERTDPAPVHLSDILWRSAGGQDAIWEMNGLNAAGGGAVNPNPGPAWQTIGTGDFFGGGDSDLLWQTTSGQIAIWEMNGASLIGGGTVSANPGPAWHAVGTGDFDGDGLSDILLQATSGQVAVWDMNGTSIVGGGAVSSNPGPGWKAVGTGDFNHDGHSDILLQAASGQVAIWEMNGNNLIGGGVVSANPGPGWNAIGTGDFYGNGDSDILFQNASSGQVAIWEMNGTSLIGGGALSANPGPSWHAIGSGGGGSDILLQSMSGQTAIWDMSGTSIAGGGTVSPNPGPSWRAVGLT
jgi:FG-GAP-like repeat